MSYAVCRVYVGVIVYGYSWRGLWRLFCAFLRICLRSVGIDRMNTGGQKDIEHTLTVAMKSSVITMTSGASRRQGKARYGSA